MRKILKGNLDCIGCPNYHVTKNGKVYSNYKGKEMCIRDREKLNEGFLRLDPILFGKGAMANSGVAVVYNVFIKIRKAWVDPEFDYGRCFNYKETKWTSCLLYTSNIRINNYLKVNQKLKVPFGIK